MEALRAGPLTAGDLSDMFPVSKPTMSAHFNVLREAGLVESHKDGKAVVYRLKITVLEDALLSFGELFGIGVKEQTSDTSGKGTSS